MKITNDKSTDIKGSFNITADKSEINLAKNSILKLHQKDLKLSGFRPGKAPLDLVEKNIDNNLLANGALEEVINNIYVKAIEELQIKTVGQPQIDVLKFVPYSSIEIKVSVDKIGKVVLPELSKITIKKPVIKVTDKLLKDALENLRLRSAEYSVSKNAVKRLDKVTIDFNGTDPKTNKDIEGTNGKDYPLIIGSNSFIPGFEDELIGLKINQEKSFDITFPKNYSVASFAGRIVNFTVKVKEIESAILDELDDKFASKVGPFKNLTELKDQLSKEIEYELKIQAKRKTDDDILSFLANNTKTNVPASLIENEYEFLMNANKKDALNQGLTWEEYLKQQGVSEKEYESKTRKFCKERVISGIAIGEIAQDNKIEVTKEELDAQIEILKHQYREPEMQNQIDDPNSRREIIMRMITGKVLNYIEDKFIK